MVLFSVWDLPGKPVAPQFGPTSILFSAILGQSSLFFWATWRSRCLEVQRHCSHKWSYIGRRTTAGQLPKSPMQKGTYGYKLRLQLGHIEVLQLALNLQVYYTDHTPLPFGGLVSCWKGLESTRGMIFPWWAVASIRAAIFLIYT